MKSKVTQPDLQSYTYEKEYEYRYLENIPDELGDPIEYMVRQHILKICYDAPLKCIVRGFEVRILDPRADSFKEMLENTPDNYILKDRMIRGVVDIRVRTKV